MRKHFQYGLNKVLMKNIDIEKEYQELIQYLSCLGDVKLYKDYMSMTLRIFDTTMKEILKVELSIPRVDEEYDTTFLSIRWKAPSYTGNFKTLRFNAFMNQEAMFNILLFDITNWKLDYLNDK